jgi:hypothetical protein
LNLSRHWKFRRLARAVGSPVLARGLLELLWEAAYEAASEYIGGPADIADAAGWTGEPLELVAILREAELLDERAPGEYVVHDLWDHAPKYVQLRWTRAHPETPPERRPWREPPPIENNLGQPYPITGTSRPAPPRPEEKKEQRRRSASSSSLPLEKAKDAAPRSNVRVLVRLAYELGERFATEADLADALKTIAARYRVPYDGSSIGRALELLAHRRAPLWLDAPRPARQAARRRTS